MKFKKHISKQVIRRILLIFTVICSAIIFDLVFDSSSEETVKKESSQAANNHFISAIFCNMGNGFKIMKGADRLFQKLLFSISKNEFLEKHHNFRCYHIIKAEELTKKPSFFTSSHFMKFTVCHQTPDENPLL